MAFDTDAYIHDLATVHGLAPKPGDTDRAELISRAVRTELEDIRARAQALHDWSAAVIADHDTGRPQAAKVHPNLTTAHRRRPSHSRASHQHPQTGDV